jgi:uncharacterized membrane protein
MDRTPSKPKAALWMAGWLCLMLIVAVAGREAARELNVFELMQMRCILGFFMLYPLIRVSGGLAAMKTARPLQHIVRPSTGEINSGQLIALGAAVGFGISVAMMKSLTRTESTVAIIFWMLAIQCVAGLLPTLYVWKSPSLYAWGWIAVIAFCGTFSHYCMARAMLHADATVVLPMDFLRVPLTATVGWLIYSERLDALTVLGAALILTGNLLNLRAPGPVAVRVGT